jgi:hypothetical protein
MVSEQTRRSIGRMGTLDLRRNCPVCGNAYQPGERVLALLCLSFEASAVPPLAAAAGGDPGGPIILGHHRCVLPRLLTLLAGFQPEMRFATASETYSPGDSAFPERYHDQP